MNRSWEELMNIAEKASSLYERLEAEFVPGSSDGDERQIENRLETWYQNIAEGDEERFIKRLSWDGIQNKIQQIMDSKGVYDGKAAPPWIYTLQEAVNLTGKIGKGPHRFLDPDDPIPFEEIFLPFIYSSVQKLRERTGDKYLHLSEEAHCMLERALLERLSKIGSMAFQFEFKVYKLYEKLFAEEASFPNYHSTNAMYLGFVHSMLNGEMFSFFTRYPVLAKLLSLLSDFWVEANAEFLHRFDHDKKHIQQIFFHGKEMGRIIGIESQLSDSHHHGRTVMIVKYATGEKLVYKPRDLGIEEAFFQFLLEINKQCGLEIPLKCLKLVNRRTYGWVEYVEHLPCKDQDEVSRYYKRAGMLLSLLSMLQGTDVHFENLIANGEHPVLIDLEMLFNPFYTVKHSLDVNDVSSSVLRTGMLHISAQYADKKVPDLSGLGGGHELKTSFRLPKWEHINSDSMSYSMEIQNMPPQKNRVVLKSRTIAPYEYSEEIILGFQSMYLLLLRNRDQWLAEPSALSVFRDRKIRFVFRPTMLYAMYLNKTLQPIYMKDGLDRSMELDRLSKKFLASQDIPRLWPLLEEEHRALERMDIPHFSFTTSGDALTVSEKKELSPIFQPSAYEMVRSVLQHLSDSDLKNQVAMIRSTWDKNESFYYSAEDLIAKASSIAGQLQKMLALPETYSERAGYNLYAGGLGVAVFYAALAKITQKESFRVLALQEIETLRKNFRGKHAKEYAEKYGIGGAAGLGSMVYALVRIHDFLGDPSILDEAKRVANLISEERIARDRHFDIISGSAGAILGLVALYSASGDEKALAQAIRCGKHLLDHLVASESGLRAWKIDMIETPEGKLLTGFSHGAAGIAYALFRLFQVTKNVLFEQAAQEAVMYEKSVFSEEFKNWPDYRTQFMPDPQSPHFMHTWCYGWPGIGLSRLGILPIWENPAVRQDISIALERAKEWKLHGLDHLCCGNFGIIDFLVTASNKLSHKEWYQQAMNYTAVILMKEELTGRFTLSKENVPNSAMEHSFFRGLSGIGYELLRLAAPDQLPSILLFE